MNIFLEHIAAIKNNGFEFYDPKLFNEQFDKPKDNKKIFSIFPGSRPSEINVLVPILLKFIKMMNEKYKDLFFVFQICYLYHLLEPIQ